MTPPAKTTRTTYCLPCGQFTIHDEDHPWCGHCDHKPRTDMAGLEGYALKLVRNFAKKRGLKAPHTLTPKQVRVWAKAVRAGDKAARAESEWNASAGGRLTLYLDYEYLTCELDYKPTTTED